MTRDLRLETARLHIQAQQLDEAHVAVDTDYTARSADAAQAEDWLWTSPFAWATISEPAMRRSGCLVCGSTLRRRLRSPGKCGGWGWSKKPRQSWPAASVKRAVVFPRLAASWPNIKTKTRWSRRRKWRSEILRATRTPPSSQTAQGVSTSESQYRNLAIQCLSKSGKLKEMIAALEGQIERTPTASQLYETLAEYYQLAGDVQKGLDLTARLVELRPDDAETRYRYAQELYRRQKFVEACEQFKIVLKNTRFCRGATSR